MTNESTSKPDITGDVEIPQRDEQAPPPPYKSTSSLPQTVGGPPPSSSQPAMEGDVKKLMIAGVAIEISEKQIPMVGIFLSSMVNVIAVCLGVDPSHRYYQYAISTGSVGMGLSAIGTGISWKPALDRGSLGKWLSVICVLWSFIAACILTFGRGPFVQTGNGYFTCWTMVIFSVRALGITAKQMEQSAYNGSSLLGLGMASGVLIIGLSIELVESKAYQVNVMYSLILSIVTLIFVERLRDFEAFLKSAAITCFAIMWMVAACLLTFEGPFLTTGNVYFAAWGATISCVYAANDEFLAAVSDWVNRNVVSPVKHLAGHFDEENPAAATSSQTHYASSAAQGTSAARDLGIDHGDLGTTTNTVTPYVEDVSTDEQFQLSIDLPGVSKDDVDVHLDGNMLVISGTRNADDAASARTMTKSFEIDLATVEMDQLTAKLENGVLHVAAPRKAKKEVKKIAISG